MGVWEYGSFKIKYIYYFSNANYIFGIQILSNTIVKCAQFTHIFEKITFQYLHTPILPYSHTFLLSL
jgi:hypothetical protein